jgi:hypothetical protein
MLLACRAIPTMVAIVSRLGGHEKTRSHPRRQLDFRVTAMGEATPASSMYGRDTTDGRVAMQISAARRLRPEDLPAEVFFFPPEASAA